MELDHDGDLVVVMKEGGTSPNKGATSESKAPAALRNNPVEENVDSEIAKINECAVDNKIHPGEEMDDDGSESSFGSRKKKERDYCSCSCVLTLSSVP